MADQLDGDSRTRILDAALALFLERGYAATSIAGIRAASGASTGSIYHFFENKAALTRALLERAVAGWSAAAGPALVPDAAAEVSIKATVAGLVRWGTADPALLRFMDEIRTLADADPAFGSVRSALADGRALGEAHYARFLARGEVRPLPWPIAHSLMLGPAYNYLRLVGGGERVDEAAAALLAEGAWAAVRA